MESAVIVERDGCDDARVAIDAFGTVGGMKGAIYKELNMTGPLDEFEVAALRAGVDGGAPAWETLLDGQVLLEHAGIYGDGERIAVELNGMFFIRRELRDLGVTEDTRGHFLKLALRAESNTKLLRKLLSAGYVARQEMEEALCNASMEGTEDVVHALIDHGGNVDAQDPSSCATALSLAAWAGWFKVVHLLVEAGADVNQANYGDGETPFLSAVKADDFAIATYLSNHGADLNAKDANGVNGMCYAARAGQWVTVKFIVERGGELDGLDDDGCTALMRAAAEGHLDIVMLFIAHGAAIDRRSLRGITALKVAAQWGHASIVRVLLSRGADPNAVDDFGETPVVSAIVGGHLGILRALVEAGGDLTVRTRVGKSARKIAQEWGHREVEYYIRTSTGCCVIA
eukprot:TRINITY_DN12705_c0_g1_i2.p1 TRINITY_DN12705_c0_g1~~TRINITY_DN12705_c0_g1_i2.p1  ORF type:complete len:427 (+),score=161.00 TRINITY_DN12705_c0_g1_i2:80-1282(+)